MYTFSMMTMSTNEDVITLNGRYACVWRGRINDGTIERAHPHRRLSRHPFNSESKVFRFLVFLEFFLSLWTRPETRSTIKMANTLPYVHPRYVRYSLNA